MQKLLIALLYNIETHHRRWAFIGLLVLLLGFLLGSSTLYDEALYKFVDNDPDRGAKIIKDDSMGDHADRVVYLDQGWQPADSLWYYNITQGSDLLPYDFFLALKSANSDELFRDDQNISRYRYLPQKPTLDQAGALDRAEIPDNKGAAMRGPRPS